MSASKGNYIGLAEPPEEQFGKAMRISDEMLAEYYRLVMESDEDVSKLDPMEAKLELARFIVRRSHGEEGVARGEEHFTRVVREGQPPEEMPRVGVANDGSTHLPALLVEHLGIPSTSEPRRLISQGAVKVNGVTVSELDVPTTMLDEAVVQAGKRHFART